MQVWGRVGGKEAGEQPGGHGPPHPRFSCRGFKIHHVLPFFFVSLLLTFGMDRSCP